MPPASRIMASNSPGHCTVDPEAEAAEPARSDALGDRRWGQPGHDRLACWRSRPGQADPRRYRATGFVTHRATRSGTCCINSCSTIAAAVATFSEFAIPSIGIATA